MTSRRFHAADLAFVNPLLDSGETDIQIESRIAEL
jgi:hypothetical protein